MNTLRQTQIRPQAQRGFTLIELMIVVVLVGIITAIAIPNYQAFLVSSRIKANANLLHTAISDAKAAAIVKGNVTICKSDNPEAAAPVCSAVASNGATNVGWGSGWITFIDANNNGVYDGGDTLLSVQPAVLRSVSEGSIVPNPPTQSLTISLSGNMFGTARSFYIQPPASYVGAPYDRYVCISSIGRVSVVKVLPC